MINKKYHKQVNLLLKILPEYEDFEETRNQLVIELNKAFTLQDKKFLLSIQNLTPDWHIYDFQKFPAVQWKIKNLEILKVQNPKKYQHQNDLLKQLVD